MMDNLAMLILIMLAVAGYVRLIRTPGDALPLKILAFSAVVFCLVPFMILTLGRIDSQWWTGNAQASRWMIGVMALGFVALIRNREVQADA